MSNPIVRSPLLIARGARSAGGRGGRRLEVLAAGDGYRVRVTGDVRRDVVAPDPLAAVQHFNQALLEAQRAGLTAVPAPAALTVDELARAERR